MSDTPKWPTSPVESSPPLIPFLIDAKRYEIFKKALRHIKGGRLLKVSATVA